MDPITLAILSGAGGTALTGAGTLIGGASLARENKRRLEELKRKEEANALGLTDKEVAAISGRLTATADVAAEQAAAERSRALAGAGSARGGEALQQAVLMDAARAAQKERVSQTILEQDLAREAAQKEEMRALEAAVAERRREAVEAAASIGAAGLEAGLMESRNQAIMQGAKDISPTKVKALATSLGVTEEEARGLYELSLQNPEMLSYMGLIQGGGK
jgi:hypothetical protein